MAAPPNGVLFYDGRAKPLSVTGAIQPGAYYQFYNTGTLTLTNVYADGGLVTPLSQTPVTGGTTAASDGRLVPIYLNPATTYRYQLYSAANALLADVDPYVPSVTPTATQIGQAIYPITAAETAASITPVSYIYPPGNAFRYGVDPTGTTDSTITMQNWINAAWAMFSFPDVQGLWNGGGGANPVLTLPPGKFKLTGTIYLPTGCSFRGTGHPAHTTNHTRLIMDSTGTTPGRPWSATTAMPFFAQISPSGSPGNYFRALSGGTVSGAGTTGGTQPTWVTTTPGVSTTVDGTVTWTYIGTTSAGDNRNKPLLMFGRGTLPRSGAAQPPVGSVLANSGHTSSIQDLEFWYVTLNNSFANPLGGNGITIGDYPNGGSIAFDVDGADFYIVDCVFQASPAAFWCKNISTASATRGDGFTGNRGIGVFIDRCEFDAAGAHIWAQNCWLNMFMRNSYFFNALTRFDNCTGYVTYQGCQFYGSMIDGQSIPNGFLSFQLSGGNFAGGGPIGDCVKLSLANTTLGVVNISDNLCTDANGNCTFNVTFASAGKISNNAIDSSGFNAPAGAGQSSYVSAIKLTDCQNVVVQGNSITATNGGTYNGFGILTGTSGARASQSNLVDGNAVTAPYNGATVGGQDRAINLATGDIYGQNFNSHNSTTTVGTRALSVQLTSVTTGTATVGAGDHDLTVNFAGTCTLTLPTPATCGGRELYVRTITANAVNSAGSNVVPLIGGAAGTAILAATAGKWARLVSDGASWNIVASN